jgi:H+/gluconate symporter-like permease
MLSPENRSHGAALGAKLADVCNGTRFRSVLASQGDYATPAAFVDGFALALTIGAATVALGAAAALLIPRNRGARAAIQPALATA